MLTQKDDCLKHSNNLKKLAAIESNRAMPSRCRVTSYGEVIALSDTIRKLQVGQSFVVDTKQGRNSALQMGSKLKIKLTSAKDNELDGENAKYRIWRVEEK